MAVKGYLKFTELLISSKQLTTKQDRVEFPWTKGKLAHTS